MSVTDKQPIESQEQRPTEHDAAGQTRTHRRRVAIGVIAVLAGVVVAAIVVLGGTGDNPSDGARQSGARAPAAATTSTVAVAPARSIRVTLKEFTVSPTPSAGRAGTVTFSVRNGGAVRHEFVVLRTNTAAADLVKGSEADEAGNVGEIGDIQPGAVKSLKLNLTSGHYALICNLPGHYLAGQHADFTVK